MKMFQLVSKTRRAVLGDKAQHEQNGSKSARTVEVKIVMFL